MIKFLAIVTVFLFVLILPASSQQPLKEVLSTDLKFYRDSLPIKHKNLFSKLSRDAFITITDDLENRIPKLSTEQFYAELMKIQAAIGDEHSTITPPYSTRFPIKLEAFEEGMVITGTDEINQKARLSRIISIDGHSMNEVDKYLSKVIIGGNPVYYSIAKASYLTSPGLLYGLGLIDNQEHADLGLISAAGDTLTVRINAISKSTPIEISYAREYNSLLANSKKENYWFVVDKTNLYFNYSRCQEDPKRPFKTFNSTLFKAVKKEKPKKIIIDLRTNSGGNSAILEPFIEKLNKSSLNKKDKIYVLIGKATFSSALMNAIKLKIETKATLIGETTAGTINHYGEVRSFELPGTKVKVNYSTQYWENWKGHDGPLIPDVKIGSKLSSLLAERDEVMDYVKTQ